MRLSRAGGKAGTRRVAGGVPAGDIPRANIGIPLIFMGSGGLCMRGPAVAMPNEQMAATRVTEAKADELGLGYLDAAGYDPGALADFYGRLPKSQRFDPGAEYLRGDAWRSRNCCW